MTGQAQKPSMPCFTTPSQFKSHIGFGSRSWALNQEKVDPSFPRRIRISTGMTAWKTEELIEFFSSMERVN